MIFHAIKAGGVDTLIERYTRAARGDLIRSGIEKLKAGGLGNPAAAAKEDPHMNCPSWLRIRRLETASDDAERLYVRQGWQRVGDIPDYALWPAGGFCSTTIFFKELRGTP